MKSTFPLTRTFVIVSALLPLIAQVKPATDQPQDQPQPVKTEVTVTGTRTATDLDHSTVATSLVTREEMDTRNIIQVDQALTHVEGVNAYRTRGPNDSDFGVGLRGFSGRGGASRTLILLDGQPLNNSFTGSVNWALLPVSEFERVEVARGPFSSLYGGNAMGGVINLITRPINRRQLEIFGEYGSRETTNYSVHASDQYFGKLGLSVGYQRYQTGGYQDQDVLFSSTTGNAAAIPVTGVTPWQTPTGGSTFGVGKRGRDWFNQQAYRGRVEYTFTPKSFASFQYFRENRSGGYDAYDTYLRGANGQPVDSGLVSFQNGGITRYLRISPSGYLGLPGGQDANIYQGQYISTLSNHWNLRVMGGVNQSPTQWYITPGADATLSSGSGVYSDQSTRALYGNVQVGWTPASRHQLIFGTDFRQDKANATAVTVPNYASRANGGPLENFGGGQSVNQSGYVQDQIVVTEKLNLVVGGRYDYWRTFDGASQTSRTASATQFPDRSTNAFTGKAAASYAGPFGLQLRASVGNAFRNPTVYELYRDVVIGSSLYLGNPKGLPEHLLSFDTGVQKRFGSGSSLDVSFYQNNIRDLLYRTTDFVTDPTGKTLRLTNAGMGRTRGVEIAARERVLPWLEMKQTYTYTNALITENAGLPATVGKRIPNVPAQNTSFIVLGSSRRWFGSVSGRYQGVVYSTDVNSDVVRGVPQGYNPFFDAEASVGYHVTSRATLTANVNNLLDRRYYLYYLNPGRQVLVGLRIRL